MKKHYADRIKLVREAYGEDSRSELTGALSPLPYTHSVEWLILDNPIGYGTIPVFVMSLSRERHNESRENWSISETQKTMCDHLVNSDFLVILNLIGINVSPDESVSVESRYRVFYCNADGTDDEESLLTQMKDPESYFIIEAGYLNKKKDWRVVRCS